MDRPDMEEASSDLETTCDLISVGKMTRGAPGEVLRPRGKTFSSWTSKVFQLEDQSNAIARVPNHELHVQSSSAAHKGERESDSCESRNDKTTLKHRGERANGR